MEENGMMARSKVTDFSIEGILASEEPRRNTVHQQVLGYDPERSAFSKPRHEPKSAFSAPAINIENRARAVQSITTLRSNAKVFLNTTDDTSRVTGNKVLTVVDGNTQTSETPNALPQYASETTKDTLSPCGACKKTFTSPLSLKRHQRSCYIKEGSGVIVEADTVPTDMTSLGRICDGRTVYICPYCKYQTNYSNGLKVHLVTHTTRRPFQCNECGKKFKFKKHLTQHHRTHTGYKPFKCSECTYSSSNSINLKNHIANKHNGESCYECNECSYRTVYSTNMTVHMRTHTGEKPYKCVHCDFRTTQKNHLINHIRTHTGERPYMCDNCEFRASDKTNLTKHIKSMHTKK